VDCARSGNVARATKRAASRTDFIYCPHFLRAWGPAFSYLARSVAEES